MSFGTWRGYTITLPFAYKHPRYKRLGYHTGLDLRFWLGSHQPAFADGIARFRKQRDSLGNTGTITMANGDVLLYAHLANNGILVKSGSKVSEKQPVFVTGETGAITDVHAHIEYQVKGSYTNVRNPVKALGDWSKKDMLHGKTATQWYQTAANYMKEIVKRDKSIIAIKKECNQLKKEASGLKDEVKDCETRLKTLSGEYTKALRNNESFFEKNKELASKVKDQSEEIKRLEKEIGKLMAGEAPKKTLTAQVVEKLVTFVTNIFKRR